MDEQTINSAYEKLSKARFGLWESSERTISRRIELEKARAERLLSGEISGKNESEREAKARQILQEEYAGVESAEIEERRARMAYDLAKIEVERIEAILKLLSKSNK